jgi:formate hydrogenlyase transcriptional activator
MFPETNSDERYRALLDVSEKIAAHRDLQALFHDLAQTLHRLVQFDYLNLLLYDPVRNRMRLHVLETSQFTPVQVGSEFPVDESPAGWVVKNQQPLMVPDIEKETRFPEVIPLLRQASVRAFCTVPLTTAHRRLGALGFGSMREYAYAAQEIQFIQQVAAQVAVAVDNALNYQNAQDYQRQLARERDRLQVALDVTNALVSNLDRRELFSTISTALRRVIAHEYTSLCLLEPGADFFTLRALDYPDGRGTVFDQTRIPVSGSVPGSAIAARRPIALSHEELKRLPVDTQRWRLADVVRSVVCVPLVTRNRVLGTLNIASERDQAFTQEDIDLLTQIGNQIAIAIENAQSYSQIAALKDKLAEEKLYLEDEIRTEYNFEEIIGESAALKRALREVETVAATDSTVLILGESGTGKELIARAIHNLSSRRARTLVRVNCAAIPTGLLESELFGHERGAFTGAIAQKIGRFELANGGTIFLDEVGDIPLELQPKLLRVLQEREFERLGSNRTIRVDVRLVTATNRDLGGMVADRQFREDLYYRLNVFPIQLPPLRDRREDIPRLVRYFVQNHAQRINKQIATIPSDAMEALTQYAWPGNVRELENIIERAVILSRGPTLQIPTAELKAVAEPAAANHLTLEAADREHILRTLKETNWLIGGPHGAAARLGMKRTTLQSRMQKLGIERRPA